jgi:hypothetical protein
VTRSSLIVTILAVACLATVPCAGGCVVDSEDDLDTEGVQTPGLPPEEVVSHRSAPPARPLPPGSGVPAGALVLRRSAGPGAPAAASTADAALVEEFAQRAGIALAAATLYAQQVRTTAVQAASRSRRCPRCPA